MKYCAKCGNPMEDDMLFCQKCGTKFEGVIKQISPIESKVEQIKKYNLVIEASSLSWQYIHEDGERAGKIVAKQNDMCQELCKLIREVLDNLTDEDRDIAEREIYTYVLSMGNRMCREGAKLFADRSGYQDLFNQGNQFVISGKLDAAQFLDGMSSVDRVYKIVAGVQGLNAWQLKEELDERVIYNSLEFRKLTKDLAQSFNEMWSKCVKRHTDFFLSTSIDFINTNWNEYEGILKGLSQAEIDSLNESGWDLAVDDWERNHNGGQFKIDFNNKRKQKRDERRKKEREEADKKYWEDHPEEYGLMQEKNAEIKELNKLISEKNSEIIALENQQRPSFSKKSEIESIVAEKKVQISKLRKKIFGKQKAEEKIQILDREIFGLEKEIGEVQEVIKQFEETMSAKKGERSELQTKVKELERENKELRNK